MCVSKLLQAKKYWQHSGEILSSRQADRILKVLEDDYLHIELLDCDTHDQVALTDKVQLSNLVELQKSFSIKVSLKQEVSFNQVLKEDLSGYELQQLSPLSSSTLKNVQERICSILNHEELDESRRILQSQVIITMSGMSSIFTAFRIIQQAYLREHPDQVSQIVVFGFPYLDTLKVRRTLLRSAPVVLSETR